MCELLGVEAMGELRMMGKVWREFGPLGNAVSRLQGWSIFLFEVAIELQEQLGLAVIFYAVPVPVTSWTCLQTATSRTCGSAVHGSSFWLAEKLPIEYGWDQKAG